MTPTNELRFVERMITEPVPNQPTLCIKKLVRILQQKWQNSYWTTDESGCKYQEEEWRDVPCVKENT